MTCFTPNYKLLKEIGHGCFGYVFQAYDATTNQIVAIKRIHKVTNSISREFEMLLKTHGFQNVIQILDFFYTIRENSIMIQNIVFEYMDMNLEDLIFSIK